MVTEVTPPALLLLLLLSLLLLSLLLSAALACCCAAGLCPGAASLMLRCSACFNSATMDSGFLPFCSLLRVLLLLLPLLLPLPLLLLLLLAVAAPAPCGFLPTEAMPTMPPPPCCCCWPMAAPAAAAAACGIPWKGWAGCCTCASPGFTRDLPSTNKVAAGALPLPLLLPPLLLPTKPCVGACIWAAAWGLSGNTCQSVSGLLLLKSVMVMSPRPPSL
jgi:hypothetical protein